MQKQEDTSPYEQRILVMIAKTKKAPTRILLVGLPYGLPDTDQDDFYTDKHFLDYDIVIVDPLGALKGKNHNFSSNIDNNELWLEPNKGDVFHKSYGKITQKLVSFVNKGGFAIVFLRTMPTLKHYSNNQFGNLVTVNLENYLPWGEKSIHRAHGSNIEFATQGAIGQFWEATNGLWSYEAVYIDPPKGSMLAHVKGYPDEVISDLVITTEIGHVFMTPVPNIVETSADVNVTGERKLQFIQGVRSLHEALRTVGPSAQFPDWANDYNLPGEIELQTENSVACKQIEVLQEQVKQRTKALDELCLHKLLVTGHDSALEGAVDRVLTEMGLKVEPGPKGRVDRTAIYGIRKFAVEVQGVKRGAKEDHSRALTIWVQDVALQDGKEPKGLLVVNSYRDTPLAERGGKNPWPGETIKICERQGHCAITGLQLLGLYLDTMADDTKREQLIERMFCTEGLFEGYEDWEQFLTPVESEVSKKG